MLRGDQPEIRQLVAILKGAPDNQIYLQSLEYNRYRQSFVDFVNQVEPLTRRGG